MRVNDADLMRVAAERRVGQLGRRRKKEGKKGTVCPESPGTRVSWLRSVPGGNPAPPPPFRMRPLPPLTRCGINWLFGWKKKSSV